LDRYRFVIFYTINNTVGWHPLKVRSMPRACTHKWWYGLMIS
jgi:hypothetical protein